MGATVLIISITIPIIFTHLFCYQADEHLLFVVIFQVSLVAEQEVDVFKPDLLAG